jgi:uncharacterized cupin superfamily protein
MKTIPIKNIAELSYSEQSHEPSFSARHAAIGSEIGAEKLGYRITIIPPGKKAYPYHAHLANEEMFFILEGTGTLRLTEKTHSLRPGDFVCCPVGKENPHEIKNTGDIDLKFLAVSTMEQPEVAYYPDSKKIGVYAGKAPGNLNKDDEVRMIVDESSGVDYWKNE